MRTNRLPFAALAFVVFVVACGGSSPTEPNVPTARHLDSSSPTEQLDAPTPRHLPVAPGPTRIATPRMSATSASPTNLSQDGSLYPARGNPASITVVGTGFRTSITVTLIKGGVSVPGTTVNDARVSNPTSLSFHAPAVPDNALNVQNCTLDGGPGTGFMYVPTSFGIRLTNRGSVDLPNVLLYNPVDVSCRAYLSIVTPFLPDGKVGIPYSFALVAAGGSGPPYTWTSLGLPANLTLISGTGVILGTPIAQGTATLAVTVTDATGNTSNKLFTLRITP